MRAGFRRRLLGRKPSFPVAFGAGSARWDGIRASGDERPKKCGNSPGGFLHGVKCAQCFFFVRAGFNRLVLCCNGG